MLLKFKKTESARPPEKPDTADFERLAVENEKTVYFTCLNLTGSREDALDCAQETFLKAHTAFGSFRQGADFTPWIRTIARHVCIDFLRRKRCDFSLEALREDGFDAPSSDPLPLDRLERKEQRQALRDAMSRLDDAARVMIVLRDVEGESYEDIARMLSLPAGTVKSRIHRARQKLISLLKNTEQNDDPCVYDDERRQQP
ncbi:MAG: hypothetical protein CW338_06650 [Clostridiales bacterium]|nr:hypothetical protein [Clostridiales bacterium]